MVANGNGDTTTELIGRVEANEVEGRFKVKLAMVQFEEIVMMCQAGESATALVLCSWQLGSRPLRSAPDKRTSRELTRLGTRLHYITTHGRGTRFGGIVGIPR